MLIINKRNVIKIEYLNLKLSTKIIDANVVHTRYTSQTYFHIFKYY